MTTLAQQDSLRQKTNLIGGVITPPYGEWNNKKSLSRNWDRLDSVSGIAILGEKTVGGDVHIAPALKPGNLEPFWANS